MESDRAVKVLKEVKLRKYKEWNDLSLKTKSKSKIRKNMLILELIKNKDKTLKDLFDFGFGKRVRIRGSALKYIIDTAFDVRMSYSDMTAVIKYLESRGVKRIKYGGGRYSMAGIGFKRKFSDFPDLKLYTTNGGLKILDLTTNKTAPCYITDETRICEHCGSIKEDRYKENKETTNEELEDAS